MLRKREAAMQEIVEFKRRLAEAIAWCAGRALRADPEHSLRTPSLQPPGIRVADDWLNDHWARVRRGHEHRQAFPERVQALVEARARLLRSEGRYPSIPAGGLAGGRLLVYYPDANDSSGFSGEQSGGFFDVEDAPPWDTWLWFVQERESPRNQSLDAYLVSWVPPPMIELAEQGIQMNAMDCIGWAEDLDEPFIAQLRDAGLLG
jgi:hypothetical protein